MIWKPHTDQVAISLYSQLTSSARYTLWVVDSDARCSHKFAIFIVPQGSDARCTHKFAIFIVLQGREPEWMFSTDAGRRALSSSAGFERLVVVALSREHEYENMESIKGELSSKVMELAPPSHKPGVQVPFLSIGKDIGHRQVRHRGHSDLSGDYIIEDAEGDGGQRLRRLLFLTNQNLVQSEVRLLSRSSGQRKKKKGGRQGEGGGGKIDQSYLACQHHHAMVAGLAFLSPQVTQPSVMLVGLGGGPLAAFLSRHFPQVCLDVVEIDPEMCTVASQWFGFRHSDSVAVHVADGLDYIHRLAQTGEQRDVIMFDIDSKDVTQGLSCPPPAFLTPPFLSTTSACLKDGGVFVLNLVCRDDALHMQTMDRVQAVFHRVMRFNVPQDVNKVIFAQKSPQATAEKPVENPDKTSASEKKSDGSDKASASLSQSQFVKGLSQAASKLDHQMRSVSAPCDVSLSECVDGLQLLSL
ncbi:hypothetical protein ACOMHN_066095 [Nucella lapillus]